MGSIVIRSKIFSYREMINMAPWNQASEGNTAKKVFHSTLEACMEPVFLLCAEQLPGYEELIHQLCYCKKLTVLYSQYMSFFGTDSHLHERGARAKLCVKKTWFAPHTNLPWNGRLPLGDMILASHLRWLRNLEGSRIYRFRLCNCLLAGWCPFLFLLDVVLQSFFVPGHIFCLFLFWKDFLSQTNDFVKRNTLCQNIEFLCLFGLVLFGHSSDAIDLLRKRSVWARSVIRTTLFS